MEEEARVEISLENRFKEALRKAREVIGYVKERNDGCEPSVAECLAYDMQYVEKYVKQLLEENNNLKAAALKNDDYYKEVCNKNKELEEENKKLNNANKTYINAIQSIAPVLMNEYIRTSLIKEKIKELKVERDKVYKQFVDGNRTDEKLHTRGIMLEGAIQVLQELLGEK